MSKILFLLICGNNDIQILSVPLQYMLFKTHPIFVWHGIWSLLVCLKKKYLSNKLAQHLYHKSVSSW